MPSFNLKGDNDMNRRQLLTALPAGMLGAATMAQMVEGAPAKPLTTAALARTLLGQADKAAGQKMDKAAGILRGAALELLKLDERGVVPCTTDTDCQRKNGGDGYGHD